MKRMLLRMLRVLPAASVALGLVLWTNPIFAQQAVSVCLQSVPPGNCFPVSSTNPLPVTGGGGSFTWPGTAGNAAGGATTAGTMPYVNAYIVNASSGGTSSTFGSAFPATGTAIGLTNGTNMVAWSATTNYGTAPAAIAVPAVNAYITNLNANGSALSANSFPVVIASDQAAVATKAAASAFAAGSVVDLTHGQGTMANSVPVAIASNQSALPVTGTFFQATQPVSLNSTPSLANGNGVVPTQGGNILSATNGTFTNLLQGNAVLSATNPIQVVQTSPYPATAVPVTASATGTTGATTATLTNVTGHTTYICGFSIRANATAAATNNATVTGTITGTLNFTQWTAPSASGLGVTEELFNPCVPASAISTSIAVVSGAPGTGGVISVTAWGYSI